jgi:hypothetical protein
MTLKFSIHKVGEFWELFDESHKQTIFANEDRNVVIMERKKIMDIGLKSWYDNHCGFVHC